MQASASASATRKRSPSLGRGMSQQPVAEAVHVIDRVVTARLCEFPPQHVHMGAQSVAGMLLLAPHGGFEVLAAEHAVGLGHQGLEQADAFWRKPDLLAAEPDEKSAGVEHQI